MSIETPMRALGPHPANSWRVSPALVDMCRPAETPCPVRIAAAPQNVIFDARRAAMLVIDMQNDFCAPGGWLDHIGVDIAPARAPIAPLQHLLPRLRAAGIPVIWVNWGNRPDRLNLSPALLHVYNPTGQGTGLGDPLPGSGARVLERGSWAAAIVDELQPAPDDIRVDKHRMSGFWDTPLDSILRQTNRTTLFFAGVNADQCVLATLMDANFLGYDCILVEDCTGTTSPRYCLDATLYNVRQCFGFTTHAAEIIAGIENAVAHTL